MAIKIDRIPISIKEVQPSRVYNSTNFLKVSEATPIMTGTLEITAEITAIFLYS